MRSLITVLLLVGLVLCSSARAARGVQAEGLLMLGQEEQQSVESVAHDEFASYEDEAKQIKCKDLGEWSFDIALLPEHLQAIFNSTAPFTPKALDELEVELLKQCDPTAHQYVLRLMEQARDLVAKGQPNRASSLLRGFAGCVKAEGLTDLVIADKGAYKSPLGSMEIPLVPGATVKPGWPHSEVYIGNASLYATGGPFEGYEPMLVDTRILAATGSTIASMACPFIGGFMGGVAAGKGTERIVKTVSAPFFARYHAHVKMGMSFEEFDKHFEEEIINEYVVPGTNTPLKVTYRLKNKHTGQVYSATYDAGDVAAVAGTVAHAVNGIRNCANPTAADKIAKRTMTKEEWKEFHRKLRTEAREGAARIRQLPGRERGPVVSAVVDARTGQSFNGKNIVPLDESSLHPLLRERLNNLDVAAIRERAGEGARWVFSEPGAHAEVQALNEALWAREAKGLSINLDEMWMANRWLTRSAAPAPRCGFCKSLTDGVNVITDR